MSSYGKMIRSQSQQFTVNLLRYFVQESQVFIFSERQTHYKSVLHLYEVVKLNGEWGFASNYVQSSPSKKRQSKELESVDLDNVSKMDAESGADLCVSRNITIEVPEAPHKCDPKLSSELPPTQSTTGHNVPPIILNQRLDSPVYPESGKASENNIGARSWPDILVPCHYHLDRTKGDEEWPWKRTALDSVRSGDIDGRGPSGWIGSCCVPVRQHKIRRRGLEIDETENNPSSLISRSGCGNLSKHTNTELTLGSSGRKGWRYGARDGQGGGV
ncbi:hypothetical protein Trydic_g1461 [Trypoxylus dichotomus]